MAELKLPLTSTNVRMREPSRRTSWRLKTALFAGVVLLSNSYHTATTGSSFFRRLVSCHHPAAVTPSLPQCPAQRAIGPSARPDITENNVQKLFRSAEFRNLSVSRLAGAVQIPTQDFQDMGRMGEDARWDAFYDLQKYFEETFSLLHEKLQFEVVNEHGLLYTWRGSNKTLKPVLLMSHQDTVPVAADTFAEWRYPPFSGHFDGTYINGRGSHDCKNNVVAILSALTALLEQGFEPERTVVAAFGFDEEATKYRYGAARLAEHLRGIYGDGPEGEDAFAIIVDEGGLGVNRQFGRTFATPETGEKGYLDIVLDVHVPGGHSSIPPAHTAIGILAAAVTRLEAEAEDNFPSRLAAENPFYSLLRCAAEDEATVDMDPALRAALRDPSDEGLARTIILLSDDVEAASLLHTSQAVTIFQAGNKANALPAYASALINYRVAGEEQLDQVIVKLIRTVRPVAEAMGVRLVYGPEKGIDGGDADDDDLPQFTLRLSWKTALREPSPISQTTSSSWTYLAGVIKHVFDEPGFGNNVLVSPMYAGGNTDTLFFWDLSSQIYRFGPVRAWHDEGWGGVHDVNERIALDAHMEAILFYHEFIRVFDEAEL
ncbi:carboxypeptidase s [Grosmannia clavigera kw1407]|uniref:Carboxypeptidase s n=1 Tax=Grosmannia clavigera (strain kw1407 / UAMH 11150) TaxID=655863 RepID=F0X9X5_GROCL|nr:carboxypeptidase s [Grosmannia clavigera kw1407]EFX05343.1 carboxypeptidase s [Grosmannia clavigera kw1407]